MRLAMSDELATDDDPTAEGYEVDTFATRGPDGPDSDDEDGDVEAKKTSQGRAPNSDVVFEIGDEDEAEADHSRSRESGAGGGSGSGSGNAGERQGLMRGGSATGSEETLVPTAGKRADKND